MRFPRLADLEPVLTRRGVIAYWLISATLFGLARITASSTLSYDEARSVEMAQELAGGYTLRQPPLYDQLGWLLAQALGPGAASQLALPFALVALIGWLAFLAVERASGSERFAAAGSLLLSLHSYFGWSFHHWGTHTLVLCAAALGSFVALVDLAARPGLGRAVLFGLALGSGLMSKFSFPLFLGGLFISGLSIPELRRVLCSRWMVVAALVAAALCAPYLAWLATVQGDVVTVVRAHMIPGAQSHLARAAIGLGRLGWSLCEFMAPWLAALALLMPRAIDPRAKRGRAPGMAERLARRTTGVAIALAALGIVATGATTVADHYMPPLLILAPIILFGRAAALEGTAPQLPRIASAALVATLALTLYRATLPTIDALLGRPPNTGYLPYGALAREMAARGYDRGTAVAADVREAGNLRAVLPQLRVIATGNSHRTLRPSHRDGTRDRCFAVWRLLGRGPEGNLETVAAPTLPRGLELAAREATVIEVAAAPLFVHRRVRWAVLDLTQDSSKCR